MTAPAIVWFWQDLRLNDNPAIEAAVNAGGPVIFLYNYAPDEEGPWPPGGAARWYLHHSLAALAADLDSRGSRLVLREGASIDVLTDLIETTGAETICWNRRYEPAVRRRDDDLAGELEQRGLEVIVTNGSLLHEPDEVQTKAGDPYKVFSPFFKQMKRTVTIDEPLTAPNRFKTVDGTIESDELDDFGLLPDKNWADGFSDRWTPGERGAKKQLDRFLDRVLEGYAETRNRTDIEGSSRLSPHLHWGELSPRQVWNAVKDRAGDTKEKAVRKSVDSYLSEIGWREFAYHLMWHFPHTPEKALREKFHDFDWRKSKKDLRAWQRGQTGFPIVDAAMRELWATGWMSNRSRMIVASFLTKDLLIHWREGAEWFWDCLVDADLGNNTLGWQWTSGCGADAAPYFRIYNPVSQAEKFDPQGDAIRRWCPELADLPTKWLGKPHEAPAEILKEANVTLGKDYPEPIVDHAEARDEALRRYGEIK